MNIQGYAISISTDYNSAGQKAVAIAIAYTTRSGQTITKTYVYTNADSGTAVATAIANFSGDVSSGDYVKTGGVNPPTAITDASVSGD